MHGGAALEVGQREIGGAVAAVIRTDQREKSGVLRNGQELPVAKRPAPGREISREHSDFRNIWIGHNLLLFSSIPAREEALKRDAIYHHQISLAVAMRRRTAGGGQDRW